MKAMLCTQYGSADVLKLREVAKPIPKDNEVLIRVHATTVTSGDCRVRNFECPALMWIPMRIALGLRKPRKPILGVELAGEIVAIGKEVKRFKQGDRIYALTGMRFGAYAEYTCLPQDGVMAIKPANMSYEEAAAVAFGGTTALHFFRKGKLQSGQKVLIYGASGAVGTAAVQLAKHYGAEVTGVCSTANVELVKSLGADKVVDYTKEDYSAGHEQYDLIFDAVGKTMKSVGQKVLAQGGTYVTVNQSMASVRTADLTFLRVLVEGGEYKAAIDRVYPLEQVPDAHRYVEKGHKRGNVVINIGVERGTIN